MSLIIDFIDCPGQDCKNTLDTDRFALGTTEPGWLGMFVEGRSPYQPTHTFLLQVLEMLPYNCVLYSSSTEDDSKDIHF